MNTQPTHTAPFSYECIHCRHVWCSPRTISWIVCTGFKFPSEEW